jgi:hypothetical protein
MGSESTPWKVAELVALLLTVAVPAFVAYDLHTPPPDPEKRLELTTFGGINPLRDLSALGDPATISVIVENQTFNNLVIVEAIFSNAGEVPILPSEYHKNLSVSVNEPWNIVAVENEGRFFTGVPVSWKRINDKSFEAEPALLNSGDRVLARVYLTNTEFAGGLASEETPEPEVEWNVRITNLREFSKPRNVIDQYWPEYEKFPYITVFLAGWGVPFTMGVAFLFQSLYLHLFVRSGFLREWNWRWIALVASTSLVSFAAAESISTYLIGGPLTRIISGVEHWLNLPPIILNAAVLTYLW